MVLVARGTAKVVLEVFGEIQDVLLDAIEVSLALRGLVE
jgi:hypothetical protein